MEDQYSVLKFFTSDFAWETAVIFYVLDLILQAILQLLADGQYIHF